MLQNASVLAVVAVDTAEHEPSKVCYNGLTPYNAWIPKLQPRERLFTLEELALFNASFQVVHWLNLVRMNRRESETAWLMETVQLYSGFLFLLDIRYPP